MKRTQKICYGLFGIVLGFMALFSMDMVIYKGKFIAHSFKRYQPGCGIGCHEIGPTNGNNNSADNRSSFLYRDGNRFHENYREF